MAAIPRWRRRFILDQHRAPRDARAPARQIAQPSRSCSRSSSPGKSGGRQGRRSCGISVLDEVLGDKTGVTGMRVKHVEDRRCSEDAALDRGYSLPSAIRQTRKSSSGQLEMEERIPGDTKSGLDGRRNGHEPPRLPASLPRATCRTTSTARPVLTSAGTGCMAALDAATLSGQRSAREQEGAQRGSGRRGLSRRIACSLRPETATSIWRSSKRRSTCVRMPDHVAG